MNYTLPVKYDTNTQEYYIQLSDEIIEQVGWEINDTLVWSDNKDGTFTIEKKD